MTRLTTQANSKMRVPADMAKAWAMSGKKCSYRSYQIVRAIQNEQGRRLLNQEELMDTEEMAAFLDKQLEEVKC